MSPILFALMISTSAWSATTVNFDSMKEGALGPEFKTGSYAGQGSAHWQIKKLADAPSKPNVLVQDGKAPYSWAIDQRSSFKDGSVEIKYAILDGKEDPEAGVIWRMQDPSNYYYVRTNTVEDNIVFYRMKNGKKELLKEAEIKTPYKTWHKIRLETKGEELKVYFDDKLTINTRDNAFLKEGKVGFFTTADTVCAFDDLVTESK